MSDDNLEDESLKSLKDDAERFSRSEDDWRRAALLSLAIGNGGALAVLATWTSRWPQPREAVIVFSASIWLFGAGLSFSGLIAFIAWGSAYVLAETFAGMRDQHASQTASPRAAAWPTWLLGARGAYRQRYRRYSAPFRIGLGVMTMLAGLCFLIGLGVTLVTLATALPRFQEDHSSQGPPSKAASQSATVSTPIRDPARVSAEVRTHTVSGIPARFQGEWNEKRQDCGTGRNDSRLRISGNAIRFYESAGSVSSVALPQPNEIILGAKLEGEGRAWNTTFHFKLSNDGTTLTTVGGGEPMVRLRCSQ